MHSLASFKISFGSGQSTQCKHSNQPNHRLIQPPLKIGMWLDYISLHIRNYGILPIAVFKSKNPNHIFRWIKFHIFVNFGSSLLKETASNAPLEPLAVQLGLFWKLCSSSGGKDYQVWYILTNNLSRMQIICLHSKKRAIEKFLPKVEILFSVLNMLEWLRSPIVKITLLNWES